MRRPITAFALMALAALLFPRGIAIWNGPGTPLVGHVVRAFGTVRIGMQWSRLETGKSIAFPVREGDQIQTGEHSATQILFMGGSKLELEAGTVAQIYRDKGNVVVRMILGTGYFEFAADSELGRRFAWVKPDGKLGGVPRDSRVVLTLHSAHRIEDVAEERSIEVNVVSAKTPLPSIEGLELSLLASGGAELEGFVPLIVPPIDERDRPFTIGDRQPASAMMGYPKPIYPMPEAVIGVEEMMRSNFKWAHARGVKQDPIVAYEIVVRPAFNYEVEDVARIHQVFRTGNLGPRGVSTLPLERVGGSGVFLWSVRAVTDGGTRGPASAARFLEITFPETLRAPDLLTPKVE